MIDVVIDDRSVDDILGKIDRLGPRYGKNAMRRAMRKGARVIRDRARMYAKLVDDPKSPEQIWKNIVVRGGKIRDKNALRVRVGILGGAKKDMSKYGEFKGAGKANPGGDTWYWRFVEMGVPSRGIPARPFMRAAMHEKKAAVLNDIVGFMREELAKEVLKRL